MPESKPSIFPTLVALLFMLGLFFLVVKSFQSLDYDWDFRFLGPYIWDSVANRPGIMLQGLWGTLKISFQSICLGTLLGTAVGFLLQVREPVTRVATLCYVDLFRNTPVLVQLYVMYFVVGTAFDMSAESAGVLTLSLFCSAYIADIVRGTLVNFDVGQRDAAKAVGLNDFDIARLIVLPQALRRMLPPLVGQFVSLVKDSSLVSVISILELTKAALNVVAVSFRSFETWFLIAFLYLVLNTIVSTCGRWLENRLSESLHA